MENIESVAESIPEQAGKFAATLLHKFKEGVENVKEAGEKLVENIATTAQGLTEKYKSQTELSKLTVQRDELLMQLGKIIVHQHKTEGSVKATFFRRTEVKELVEKIEALESKINESK